MTQLHLCDVFLSRHFVDFGFGVYTASFVQNAGFLTENVDVHDVKLVKRFGPPFRNSVFNLIDQLLLIRLFTQRLSNALFVQFVKLVIKLSNHLLNVLRFLFLIQLVNNCLFDLLLDDLMVLALV